MSDPIETPTVQITAPGPTKYRKSRRPKSSPQTIPLPTEEVNELEQAVARAIRVQEEMRKMAADIKVSGIYEDPRDKQIRMYVPEAIEIAEGHGPNRKIIKPATMSARYDINKPEVFRNLVSEGWQPVLSEGTHITEGGDTLWKRPIEFSKAARERAERESTERLETFRSNESSANPLMNDFYEMEKK